MHVPPDCRRISDPRYLGSWSLRHNANLALWVSCAASSFHPWQDAHASKQWCLRTGFPQLDTLDNYSTFPVTAVVDTGPRERPTDFLVEHKNNPHRVQAI